MKKNLFYVLVLCLTARLNAEINLSAAYAAALKQSEALASQQELLIQAEERYKQAVGNILPTLNLGGLWFFEQNRQLPLNQNDPLAQQSTLRLSASQPLFRGFREYAALRQAKSSVRYQQLAQDWAALQLYSDTAQAFYLVLSLEKDLATQNSEIDLYAKRIDELRDFVRIGRSRETEILSVQSAQAILKTQIEQAKAQVSAAREMLSFLTGLNPAMILADNTPAPTNLDSLDSYLAEIPRRPDIRAATANIAVARESVNISQGQHLPNVDLGANYYFQRPSGSAQDVDWDAQIAVTLPLFMGGVVTAQTRQAKSQVRQAELSLEQQTRLAGQAIRNAYNNLRYDLSQAAALDDAYQIAEKSYKAESRDYKNGLVTNLELLQSLTAYQDTQRALSRALFAAKNDFAKLQSLAAKISTGTTSAGDK